MNSPDEAIGFSIIGSWLTVAIFTLVVNWSFRYFQYFSEKDPLLIKIVVAVALGFNTIDCMAVLAEIFLAVKSVTSGGPFIPSGPQNWPSVLLVICGGSVAAIVQAFLTYRFVRLSKRRIIGGMLYFLIFITFVLGIFQVVFDVNPNAVQPLPRRTLITIYFIAVVVTDAGISFALICALYSQRTGARSADRMVFRLIRLTLQSGCIPTLFSLATALTALLIPLSNVASIFVLPLCHIYALTLLYVLNIRKDIQNERKTPGILHLSAPEISPLRDFHVSSSVVQASEVSKTTGSSHQLECLRIALRDNGQKLNVGQV